MFCPRDFQRTPNTPWCFGPGICSKHFMVLRSAKRSEASTTHIIVFSSAEESSLKKSFFWCFFRPSIISKTENLWCLVRPNFLQRAPRTHLCSVRPRDPQQAPSTLWCVVRPTDLCQAPNTLLFFPPKGLQQAPTITFVVSSVPGILSKTQHPMVFTRILSKNHELCGG